MFFRSIESLVGFIDSDWASNSDDTKSTSSYVFHLSSRPMVFLCKKHHVVSFLTKKEKYHGAISSGTNLIWIQHLLEDLVFMSMHLLSSIVIINVLYRLQKIMLHTTR